jgi:cytochrome c peroxidase
MHDGSFATLSQVINHYNVIPGDNANLDPRLRRPGGQVQNLNLTQPQRDSLVAFLATLTGSAVYSDPKWSDPFTPTGQLALVILPQDAISIQNNGDGTATVSAQGVSGVQYQLWSSPDLVSWTAVATVTPNASGMCSQTVSVSGGGYFRYAYVPPASAPLSLSVAPVVQSLSAEAVAVAPAVVKASPVVTKRAVSTATKVRKRR